MGERATKATTGTGGGGAGGAARENAGDGASGGVLGGAQEKETGVKSGGGMSASETSLLPARESYDAAVIGAGPAGAMAAYTLAREGRSVLLIERARFPRSKVCGCCLGARGVAVLDEASLGGVLQGAAWTDRLWLCDVGDASVRAVPRAAEFDVPWSRVLPREVLDTRLCRAACQAGAELCTASAAASPEGHVRLKFADGRAVQIRARVIIAADGLAGSSVREVPGLAWRVEESSRMGCGALLRREPIAVPAGTIVMIRGAEGYLGLTRVPVGGSKEVIDAAAAFDPAAIRREGGPGELAARYIRAVGGDPEAFRGSVWKGTPALTRRRERVEMGRILLAGDAASYVEPFTGEGMSWALMSGRAAARCAIERIVRGPQMPAGSWQRRHRALLRGRQRTCTLIASALRSDWMTSTAIRAAGAFPEVAGFAARCLMGQIRTKPGGPPRMARVVSGKDTGAAA